jgi:hypothetical protein
MGCGRFLPTTWRAARVEWCTGLCLDRFIEAHNLRQMNLFGNTKRAAIVMRLLEAMKIPERVRGRKNGPQK